VRLERQATQSQKWGDESRRAQSSMPAKEGNFQSEGEERMSTGNHGVQKTCGITGATTHRNDDAKKKGEKRRAPDGGVKGGASRRKKNIVGTIGFRDEGTRGCRPRQILRAAKSSPIGEVGAGEENHVGSQNREISRVLAAQGEKKQRKREPVHNAKEEKAGQDPKKKKKGGGGLLKKCNCRRVTEKCLRA